MGRWYHSWGDETQEQDWKRCLFVGNSQPEHNKYLFYLHLVRVLCKTILMSHLLGEDEHYDVQSQSESVVGLLESMTKADEFFLLFLQRGRILGEMPLPGPAESVFSMISEADKERIDAISRSIYEKTNALDPNRHKLEKHVAQAALNGFMPFKEVVGKQERYRQ